MIDLGEIRADEHHPAADSAYRWLKGFMISHSELWLQIRTAIEIAAAGENRQAQICLGTIRRLQEAKPVSDRYLLGLAWTVLYVWQEGQMEFIADFRYDRHNPRTDKELPLGGLDGRSK